MSANATDDKKVAVLGAGMHEWGKWGRPFVEYGLAAARDAMANAGLGWRDMQFVSGADTIRNGYPGSCRARRSPRLWAGRAPASSSVYAASASGAVAIANARAKSSPGCAMSRSSSGPIRRRRASSCPSVAATARTTPTGCASI